jgi:hypothetical protein
MCYAVYIGTNSSQITGNFILNKTSLYLTEPSRDKEILGLKPKFSKKYIYYVGAYQGCSCGFAYNSSLEEEDDDIDDQHHNKLNSRKALLSLIDRLTKAESLEFYCCWEDEWESQIKEIKEIDIADISFSNNSFKLIEKQFIIFQQQIILE